MLDALEQTLYDRRPVHRGGLVHHCDRGSQYASIKYTERLAEAGVEPSVGSVGDSYDNALAETINGLYKAEVIHRRGPWRSFEAGEFATLEWVEWFNNRRLLESIGTARPPKPNNATMPCWNNPPWRHNLDQLASGKPGAVHSSAAPVTSATFLPHDSRDRGFARRPQQDSDAEDTSFQGFRIRMSEHAAHS
ncbi:hypothetical protein ACVINW_003928 [Bradyrhizobium sp. USDA 4461]